MRDDVLRHPQPVVDRRARRAGLVRADRDDLLQDVVVKYLVAFGDDRTPEPDNPAAWFERTTERAIIDRFRAAGRRPQAALPEHGEPKALPTLIAAWHDANAPSLGAIKGELVEEALALLSPQDREIFTRRYLYDESPADLAQSLGVPVNTVHQRLSRARRRLEAALQQRPELFRELRLQHPRAY